MELFKAHFDVPAKGLSLVYALQQTDGAQISIELQTSEGHNLHMTGASLNTEEPVRNKCEIYTAYC